MVRFAAALMVLCAAPLLLLLAVAPGGAAAQGVGSIITRSVFQSMLPNRDHPLCPAKGFYTYDAFIAAAKSFPAFGTTGSAELRKREVAAFFGQTSHEITGGTRGAADQFQWGYCYKEEINKATAAPYYGRGPIQLTWRSNYELAGKALGLNLVGDPDLVSRDAVVSFKTALWFWMTAQSPKPSCHDVILGRWTPTAADITNRRVPGYGVITNIINGGVECDKGPNNQDAINKNVDRMGFYKRYCSMLSTAPGSNLDCYTQKKFGANTFVSDV